MKVAVTGAAGFIGSNLVAHLLEQRPQWKIVAVDALTYAGNYASISPFVEKGAVHFARVDIADGEAVDRLFAEQSFDLVMHLAAESHVDRSIHSAHEFVRTNVIGTQMLINASRAHAVKKFIHISTDEVYGSLGPTGRFHETTPLDPTSPYAASKASSDLMVLAAWKTHHFPACITRCTNNYGPYQFPEKLIPLFITNALEDKPLPLYGDGLNVREWIYVTDHCRALLAVAERGAAGEVYNIGGGEANELTNIAVTKAILKALQKAESLVTRVADRLAHDRRYAIDHSKIERELGWKPAVSFAEGITRTVEWYLSHREWWETVKSGAYRDYYERQYGSKVLPQ